MKFLSNYIHLLTLSSLAVFINATWTADLNVADIIAENILTFGHQLGLKLTGSDPNITRNEVFSPVNIMAALSLLTLGAKGKSYQELEQILGLNSIPDPQKYYEEFGSMLNELQHKNLNSDDTSTNYRQNAEWRETNPNKHSFSLTHNETQHIVKITNGLFVQNGFTLNPDYRQVLESIFKTEVKQLDFQNQSVEAREKINAWVKEATYGKIPEIIKDDIAESTNVILVSTLYFKSYWELFFDNFEWELNFYPDGKNAPSVQVNVLSKRDIYPFYNAKEHDCRIIGIPYKDNQTTMYIIQPNDSTRHKLKVLLNSLNAYKINDMINRMKRTLVQLLLPKIHFTRSINIKEILKSMNVSDIFRYGHSDLSLISQKPRTCFQQKPSSAQFASEKISTESESTNPVSSFSTDPASSALSKLDFDRQKINSRRNNLYVDQIVHSVDFSMDEKGTEGAAATSSSDDRIGGGVTFTGMTPFLFVIRHDPTQLPLFYGIVINPKL